eukprot:CAMPEP_0172298144 /NCGR_PEP_ID=MMETSP1058-20130122/924_1 /TAXON_ID=83371 /ORGANISM="Detonula confervacea, Strain CCMP 353" /LENGTH=753 /DNA_ID=CAMNT_0013007389 /DNA_START=1 /DNA_END=2262 /DNA_ORIENTATION=-
MVISGIIRPPPDIRAVADRTALFVSKNGRAFEIKILNSQKGKTPKFAFLHDGSPFHAYYEDRIRFYNEGGTDEEEKKKEEEEKLKKQKHKEEKEAQALKEKEEAEAAAAKKEAARKNASAVDPVARALLASRAKIGEAKRAAASAKGDGNDTEGKGQEGVSNVAEVVTILSSSTGPNPPPALRHVSLVAPANLTPLEVEVIKLTAQYVALSERKDNGAAPRSDNFLSNLTLKEWANPEFAFLQPRHSHFAYFTALVDGYRSFLPGGEDYEKAQNKARMDAKKERLSHLILDDAKHPTIIKKKDTVQECLDTAAYRAEFEREKAERRREAVEGADGIFGGADTIDWHDFVVVETIEFDADEVVEALPPPTSLRLAALNKEQPAIDKAAESDHEEAEEKEEEMEESSSDEDVDMEDDDEGEKLKVVSNYQPKVVSTKEFTGDASRTHIIDPITGKSVAIADMPEHMRIQLLDPKWAEERKRFLEKQRDTNFVAGNDIASNISRFAQARGDIFGSSEAEIHDQKADSDRRLMEANQLIRDQAMQQGPQVQPPPQFAVAPPGMPPPPPQGNFHAPPPTFAPPPPPPPPPQQQMAQPSIQSEEPAAKRPKIDNIQANPNIAMAPPPPPPPGMPIAPGMAAPDMSGAPPSEDQVLSESDFIATLSNPDEVPICIRIPHDRSNSSWNFNGQTIDMTVKAISKIKEIKGMLKEQLGGMPVNKMQLKHPSTGFLKDGNSLAHFNIGPMTTLDLVPKTRGGRK